MKELTKKQKLRVIDDAYKFISKEQLEDRIFGSSEGRKEWYGYNGWSQQGLCWVIAISIERTTKYRDAYDNTQKLFPEFVRPKNNDYYDDNEFWWPEDDLKVRRAYLTRLKNKILKS